MGFVADPVSFACLREPRMLCNLTEETSIQVAKRSFFWESTFQDHINHHGKRHSPSGDHRNWTSSDTIKSDHADVGARVTCGIPPKGTDPPMGIRDGGASPIPAKRGFLESTFIDQNLNNRKWQRAGRGPHRGSSKLGLFKSGTGERPRC